MNKTIKKSQLVMLNGLNKTKKEIAEHLDITVSQVKEGMERFGLSKTTTSKTIIDWEDDMEYNEESERVNQAVHADIPEDGVEA